MAGAQQHQRLVEVGREAAAVLAIPGLRKRQRRHHAEDLGLLAAPAALLEVVGRNTRAAQELLHLVALDRRRGVEDAQELPRHRLGVHWRRHGGALRILVDQAVDAGQRVTHVDGAAFVDQYLAIVAREVLQRLAAADDLQVGRRQAFLGVVFQHRLQLPHLGQHLAAHARPTHRLRHFGALTADVDDVVFDLLGTELAFALALVRANGVRRFQVEAGVKQ